MKKLISITTLIILFFIAESSFGQTNYINHTLQTGETLSMLAKQYNTNVGDIMRMNGMHADTKLVYGSNIKIPSVKGAKTQIPQSVPVQETVAASNTNTTTHKVVKGETLYSISKKYSVTTDEIKSWNNLTDNSLKPGSDLIIKTSAASDQTNTIADVNRQRVETNQPIAQQTTLQNAAPQPEENKATNTTSEPQNDVAENTSKEIINTPVTNANVEVNNVAQNGEGYFQTQFTGKSKHKKHVTGISKTFKTSSGWSDGKYYILADDINPGTIVKLTADNGKSVYAKVLWSMGDLKENSGINFRVSNATAAALNENSNSFNLNLYY